MRLKGLDGKIAKISHEIDLYDLYPTYMGFKFDTDLLKRLNKDDLMSPLDDLDDLDGWNNGNGDSNHLSDSISLVATV